MKYLIQLLEEGVKRHGQDQTVSLGHLLHLVKMVDKMKKIDAAETSEDRYFLEQELKALVEEGR